MLSDGLRLALLVAAPLLGASVAHETRRNGRVSTAAALVAIALCGGFAASVIPTIGGGGSLERSFGTAVPGVDFTARADAASVAAILVACLAALASVRHLAGDGRRLAGVLLCLAGTAMVAAGANLVLVVGGVEVLAAGALMLLGGRGPGTRTGVVVALVAALAGAALLGSAIQVFAAVGGTDFAFLPQSAIGPAVAVPWALAGAALLLLPAMPGRSWLPGRDWAAVGAAPAGFLILLRLQQSAAGQLPTTAVVALGVAAGLTAALASREALAADTLAAAGRAGIAIVLAVLVTLFSAPLADAGVVAGGLFLAVELGLVAASSWGSSASGWSAASLGLLVLPGGAAFAIAATGLGILAQRRDAAFPQLVLLAGALAAAAVAAARVLSASARSWRPLLSNALPAVLAGLAGGLLPGLALHQAAAPLSGGATAVDVDAGALQAAGAGFAGGYFTVAAAVVLVSVVAAFVLIADEPATAAVAAPRAIAPPRLGGLLALRRRVGPPAATTAALLARLERWLEAQPQLPLVVGGAALAVLFFR